MFKPGAWAKGFEAMKAKGRLKSGEMNKLEAKYDALLRARLLAGEIAWYAFHGLRLRLGDGVIYEPDFAVMALDGTLEIHETKGGLPVAGGMSKPKIAAGMFPFRFFVLKQRLVKDGGGFSCEEV